jgi:LDH2 family malate/lactate/ureidoglycolate dehydrogenase
VIAVPSYSADALAEFATTVLERCGVPSPDARLTADCLIDANLYGVETHGIRLLSIYARRLRSSTINPRPRVRVVHETATAAVVDGDDGLGPVVGAFAIDGAIAKAKESGVGMAVARRSHHFGAAAWYARRALAAGQIGIASSNGSPALAPWGAAAPFFGANPLAVAIPTKDVEPIVFDASTSVSSRARIRRLAAQGEAIPEGWALDADGRATVDAAEAIRGALLPFGGAKGSGLALILEVLCAALAGAGFSNENRDLYLGDTEPQGIGHFFLAIAPDVCDPGDGFTSRVDRLVRSMHKLPPAPEAGRVRLPGEGAAAHRQERLNHGIPLPENEVAELATLGEQSGVEFPAAIDPPGVQRGVDQ